MDKNPGTPSIGRMLLAFVVGLAACITVWSASAAVPFYIATPLGTLGGQGSRGEAINRAGEVVGQAITSEARGHAFLHTGGSMIDLGTFGGADSYAFGVNAHGQVAGHSQMADGSSHAFLYTAGMIDLGTLGGVHSYAFDVNASGQVTGHSWLADGHGNAFMYSGGKMVAVDTPVGSSAFGINDSGQITGYVIPLQPPYHQYAFLSSVGKTINLGTLGGTESWGHRINAGGQVTGWSRVADGSPHAFLYSDGMMKDLGTLGGSRSNGYGINASGQVTGTAEIAVGVYHAFLFADGAMHDLNALVLAGLPAGTMLFEANDINDGGQIVANGCIGGFCQAFRLDPVKSNVAIEYWHEQYDHYFVTTSPQEIARLESGSIVGWKRTGESFHVLPQATAGAADVCRFWSGVTFAKISHFYRPFDWECAIVKGSLGWQFEGDVFAVHLADQSGDCMAGTVPLYRLYNNGKGGAPNHRYTVRQSLRSETVAQGWMAEGAGMGVIGCVPVS